MESSTQVAASKEPLQGRSRMSATRTSPREPSFARARSTIAGEMSHAVTLQPRASIGTKLFPVPQATSRRRSPGAP